MTEPLLQFFVYQHLPPALREVSAPFGELADRLVAELPDNPERSAALRKLLEAKDCAVRARLYVDPSAEDRRRLIAGVMTTPKAFLELQEHRESTHQQNPGPNPGPGSPSSPPPEDRGGG